MLSRASPDASGRTARSSPLIMADHPMNNLSALEKRVIDSITEDAWLDLTRELVVAGQPDSENPLDPDMPSGHEEAIALLVAGKLEAMGLGVELRRSEEHTSELQSHSDLVCRLLLEKKKNKNKQDPSHEVRKLQYIIGILELKIQIAVEWDQMQEYCSSSCMTSGMDSRVEIDVVQHD